jgi:hypothetical protein
MFKYGMTCEQALLSLFYHVAQSDMRATICAVAAPPRRTTHTSRPINENDTAL